MSIFVEPVPIQWIYDLLEPVCAMTKEKDAFIFDLVAYKKIIYFNKHLLFLERVKPCYHVKHQHYVDREMSYKAFATILRQICKHNHVTFTSQQKFQHSDYTIEYYIQGPLHIEN